MAENCTRAFGRYLKTLRDRRGLSLQEVCSLSQTFPDPLNKGYLSRCENGHQKLAFSKLIPLSRIYEVPANVLVERMELDMELDRIGGPDTAGLTFAALRAAGKRRLDEGFRWEAYGLLRDAVHLAATTGVLASYNDVSEQIACAHMNCGTAATALGRFRFALHEFVYLETTGAFQSKFAAVILERISTCYRELRQFKDAIAHGDAAVAKAESSGNRAFLGYMYGNRARISFDQSDLEIAANYFHKAYRAYRDAGQRVECARTLNNLAQCYFDLKRYRASRRALLASQRISTPLDHHLVRAHSQLLLGEIDEIECRTTAAVMRWKDAVQTAKMLKNKRLRFQAEYLLFRRALTIGNEAAARAIRRRLVKLVPRMPENMEELRAFKKTLSRVSAEQHVDLHTNN